MQKKKLLAIAFALSFVSYLTFVFALAPLLEAKAQGKISEWVKHSGINVKFQEVKLLWNGIRVMNLEISRGDDRMKANVKVSFGLSSRQPFIKPKLVTFERAKVIVYRKGHASEATKSESISVPDAMNQVEQSLGDLLDRYFSAGISVALSKANVRVFDSKNEALISIPVLNLRLNANDRSAQISTKELSFKETVVLSQLSGQILMQKQREYYPFLLQARDPGGEPWQLKGQISHDFEAIDIRHKRKGVPEAWQTRLSFVGNPEDVGVLVRLKLDGLMSRDKIAYDITVASNNLSLQHESFGKTAIGPWPFSVQSKGVLVPETANLTINQGEFFLIGQDKNDPVHLSFSGSKKNLQASMKSDPFAINFHMRNASCQNALNAIPKTLLPTLDGLKLDGTFAIDGSLKLISQDEIIQFTPKLNRMNCKVLGSPEYLTRDWLFAGRGTIPDFLAANPSMNALKNGHPIPRSLIPDDFFKALVAAEDAKFWRHEGILIPSLVAALQANLKAGHVVFGGSTITMQLAKNLYLDRDRVISRKIQEIAIAWVLEQNLTKSEILELYANVVEFAPNTYGIGKAAALYFQKATREMTTAESLFLASILPSPKRNFSESYCRARLSPSLSQRMQKVAYGLNSLSQERDFMKMYATDLNNFQFTDTLRGCESIGVIGQGKRSNNARL